MRIVLLLLAISSIATAQESKETPPQASTSSDIREARSYGLGLGFGLFMAPISGASPFGFYSIDQNKQIELHLWSGSEDAKDFLDEDPTVRLDYFDVKARLSQIRLKYFVGNSFYVAGSLGRRFIEFDLQASNLFGDRVNANLKSIASIVGVAIGNTWTFENGFTIGGEWIGFTFPLESSFSSKTALTGFAADISDLQTEAEKAARDLGEITTTSLLTLHLAWQF